MHSISEYSTVTATHRDSEVSALLSHAELENLFDLGYFTKHVDTIFRKMFG